MHSDATFAALLRHYRIAASLTQEALAERAGLSVRGISDLERGVNTQPRLETVRLLVEALGLSVAERAQLATSAHPAAPPATLSVDDAPHVASLPISLTPLLGRDAAVEAITGLLRQPHTRLVTLTGPGGIGKTRLALAVGAALAPDFADGVHFVSLATIADPLLLAATIAQPLGVQERGSLSFHELLLVHLHAKQALLVLDNFEHLLVAAPLVTDLLTNCPMLSVVATSRAPLRLSGEQEWPVPPLALPDAAQAVDSLTLAQSPAVALFVQRAHAVDPAFCVTDANAAAIVALCIRLDGVPLAIELAAARVKLFTPPAMLARMGNALQFLADGLRDAPARQQTLRNTLAWSFNLLGEREQALFSCLAIFVGGWTLTASRAVYTAIGGDADEVMAATAALLEHSLIRRESDMDGEGEPRFGMPETIREYAREQLAASGRQEVVAQAHASYFLAFGEQFYETPSRNWAAGMRQPEVLARFEAEHDNLRAALGWALAIGEAELALRLVKGAKMFWQIRGHLTEGRRWFAAALAQATDVHSPLRAAALDSASFLTWIQGDYVAARSLAEEGLGIYREWDAKGDVDAKRGLSSILYILALIAQDQRDHATARTLLEESLAIGMELRDEWRIGFTLFSLGELAQRRGDYGNARSYFEESLYTMQACGNTHGSAWPLNGLGSLARDEGDFVTARKLLVESAAIRHEIGEKRTYAQSIHQLGIVECDEGKYTTARALLEESLALFRTVGDRQGIAAGLVSLAVVEHREGDDEAAQRLCEESLSLAHALGDTLHIAQCLSLLAEIAAGQQAPLRAARLWGAAAAVREAIGTRLPPIDCAHDEQVIALVRARCAERRWQTAWAEGTQLLVDQVVQLALHPEPASGR